MGPRTFTTAQEFLWYYYSLVCGLATGRNGVIVIAPLLLSYCDFSFVLGCGLSFFGGFQHLPVNGYSKSSCDSGGLAEDECTSFYSALLNQSEYFIHFNV